MADDEDSFHIYTTDQHNHPLVEADADEDNNNDDQQPPGFE